jgi:hypothetical protein
MALTGENQSVRENPVQCKFLHNEPHMDFRMTEPGHPLSAFPNMLSGNQLHSNFVLRTCPFATEIGDFRRNRRNNNTDIQIIRMKKNTHTHTHIQTMGYNSDTKQETHGLLVIFVHRAKSQSILNTLLA